MRLCHSFPLRCRYMSYLSDGSGSPEKLGQDETLDSNDHSSDMGSEVVWASAVLEAPDQLRQRVAWALSQILVISESGAMKQSEQEVWTTMFDIFVRNAFTNYRTLLKEIVYSPMMARYATHCFFKKEEAAPGLSFSLQTVSLH
jgi:hypothetical protein